MIGHFDLSAVSDVISGSVIGTMSLGELIWNVAGTVAACCNAYGWVEARLDELSVVSRKATTPPYAYRIRLREVKKDARDEGIAIQVQLFLLVIGILAALSPPARLNGEPSLVSVLGPVVAIYAECLLAYGSVRKTIDRHNNRRDAVLR